MQLIFGPTTPAATLSADEVADAYPWPDSGPWVRAMMVTTLDGAAAGPDHLSDSISSAADQLVFNSVRRFADAVLVGSGTFSAEQYSPMRAKPADAERRVAAGQQAAPVITVVSGSLRLPWDLPTWEESTHRPIVVTRTDADPDRLAEARKHADVITLPDLTPATIVGALTERGLRRIVCEGGPRLLNDFVRHGRIDELDITISPAMAGTATSPETPALDEVASFALVSVLAEDDFLMARYVRKDR